MYVLPHTYLLLRIKWPHYLSSYTYIKDFEITSSGGSASIFGNCSQICVHTVKVAFIKCMAVMFARLQRKTTVDHVQFVPHAQKVHKTRVYSGRVFTKQVEMYWSETRRSTIHVTLSRSLSHWTRNPFVLQLITKSKFRCHVGVLSVQNTDSRDSTLSGLQIFHGY